MEEGVHRYYCAYCRRYIYDETPRLLAARINSHNIVRHPADFADWDEKSILKSAQYSGMSSHALPQYTQPYADRNITNEDKKFLASARVKW